MNEVFDAYAEYYDLVYGDKDYAGEVTYVLERISQLSSETNSVLELGCGTGRHARYFAEQGLRVHGVDLSAHMLARARERDSAYPVDVSRRLSYSQGDVRNVRLGQTFDSVVSLFHVMSYQPTTNDLSKALTTCARHCDKGGILVFDFWYGPAVLHQRPELRVKRMGNEEIEITRIAEPQLDESNSLVRVNYEIWIESARHGIVKVTESHCMRYWFKSEIQTAVESAGFELCSFSKWLGFSEPDNDSWSACVVARRQ